MASPLIPQLTDGSDWDGNPCGQAFKRFVLCTGSTVIVTATLPPGLAPRLTQDASSSSYVLSTSMPPVYTPTPPSSQPGISYSQPAPSNFSTSTSPLSQTSSNTGNVTGTSRTASGSQSASSSLTSWSESVSSSVSHAISGDASDTSTVLESPPTPRPYSFVSSLSIALTASSQTFTTTSAPTPLPQHQALASNSPSKTGPIAGGIIGFLLLIVLFLLWFYRRKIASRIRGSHRVAPSAEFLDVTRAFSPRDGAFGAASGGNIDTERFTSRRRGMSTSMSTHGGSRTASPLAAHRLGSSLSMHAGDQAGIAGIGVYPGLLTAVGDGVSPDEPPPPFTPGKFNDPLVEKLNDATRQREELYRATAPSAFNDSQQDLRTLVSHPGLPAAFRMPISMPIPAPSIVDTSVEDSSSSMSHARHDSDMTRMSHRNLVNMNAYGGPFNESDAEEEMKNTSPMLEFNRLSRMSMSVDGDSLLGIKTHAGDTSSIGWAV